MVALEVALERPDVGRPRRADRGARPRRARWPSPGTTSRSSSSTGSGYEGLALARQLAMTTYRSEADFDERFGRAVERRRPVRRSSATSTTRAHKLVERFDPATYRVLVGRDGPPRHRRAAGAASRPRSRALAGAGTRLTGVGIEDDILYGPRQVRALVDAAAAAGARRRYREIRSTKGHDAFLVEWDQLTALAPEALDSV